MPRFVYAVILAGLTLTGCTGTRSAQQPTSEPSGNVAPEGGARVVQPGAPGESPRVVQPGAPGEGSRPLNESLLTARPMPYTEADVAFMQGMIGHHAQALDMTALIADRTERQDLILMGRRMEISQKSEIELMQKWLRDRDEQVPESTAHHMMHGHAEAMPGMLSLAQMKELEDASGDEFYRLWLEYMIQHHQGAIIMVGELLASEGAAQETDIFRFADAVEEDQTMEIQRMRQMLANLR
ncbi:MAG: DUF305 domain-containing protein [Rhodothermales bacterium]|nr:DUF305 domain-containing protein [Rhodothermales bacterium]MBO6779315.1 DUF305 domain-containing protein [Rhodothermales bacterium]